MYTHACVCICECQSALGDFLYRSYWTGSSLIQIRLVGQQGPGILPFLPPHLGIRGTHTISAFLCHSRVLNQVFTVCVTDDLRMSCLFPMFFYVYMYMFMCVCTFLCVHSCDVLSMETREINFWGHFLGVTQCVCVCVCFTRFLIGLGLVD